MTQAALVQLRTRLEHLAMLTKLDLVDIPSALPLLDLNQPGLVEEAEGPVLPDELQECVLSFDKINVTEEGVLISYSLDCMFVLIDFVSRVTRDEVSQRDQLQITKNTSLTDIEQKRAKNMLEKHFLPFSVNCRMFDIKFPVKRRRLHDSNQSITWGTGLVVNQQGELKSVIVDASEMMRLNSGATVESAKFHGGSSGLTNRSSPASPKDEWSNTDKDDRASHIETVRARLNKIVLPMPKKIKDEEN